MRRLVFLCPLFLSSCSFVGVFYPPIKSYVSENEGKAILAEAEYSKQAMIQDAKAKEESAKYLANAEIERAKGIAKANQIIGDSLKDNEGYLRWLYIDGLKDNKNKEVIYIPTEASMPILERRK